MFTFRSCERNNCTLPNYFTISTVPPAASTAALAFFAYCVHFERQVLLVHFSGSSTLSLNQFGWSSHWCKGFRDWEFFQFIFFNQLINLTEVEYFVRQHGCGFLNPRFGTRRWIGICPPSCAILLWHSLHVALLHLCYPLVEVPPLPDASPRPKRFSLCVLSLLQASNVCSFIVLLSFELTGFAPLANNVENLGIMKISKFQNSWNEQWNWALTPDSFWNLLHFQIWKLAKLLLPPFTRWVTLFHHTQGFVGWLLLLLPQHSAYAIPMQSMVLFLTLRAVYYRFLPGWFWSSSSLWIWGLKSVNYSFDNRFPDSKQVIIRWILFSATRYEFLATWIGSLKSSQCSEGCFNHVVWISRTQALSQYVGYTSAFQIRHACCLRLLHQYHVQQASIKIFAAPSFTNCSWGMVPCMMGTFTKFFLSIFNAFGAMASCTSFALPKTMTNYAVLVSLPLPGAEKLKVRPPLVVFTTRLIATTFSFSSRSPAFTRIQDSFCHFIRFLLSPMWV